MPLAPPVSTPPLLEGDSLSTDEFLRRWEQIPGLKQAELINGIVYMPSPVSLEHQECQSFLNGWLDQYACHTPGCRPVLEGTWLMGEGQVPQPDATLRILPDFGGQSGVLGAYPSGAPELVVEVALSSRARDFGVKKQLYERRGVREYLIAVPRNKQWSAFSLTLKGFEALESGLDGIFRSRVFPGLWLDITALWDLDLPRRNLVLQQGLATREHADFVNQLAAQKRNAG